MATLIVGLMAAPASAQVKRWGSYFGAGEALEQPTPGAVPGLGSGVTQVAAGNASTYVLQNGRVWAFGDGEAGELGNGLDENSVVPVEVGLPSGTYKAIGEAKDAGYAISASGQGYSWGALGSALCTGERATRGEEQLPTAVPGITEAAEVRGGGEHVIWLMRDGTVRTCGLNTWGQLGVGAEIRVSRTPIRVPGLTGIVEVSCGNRFSAARNSAGEVFMWGENEAGQIGQGRTSLGIDTPVKVDLPEPAVQISLGGDLDDNGHALAVSRAGVVYGWGYDRSGQLGDGSEPNRASPIALPLDIAFKSVAASGTYSLGLTSAGNVFAWGSDLGGGMGTETSRKSAVLVDSGATMISATATDSVDN
jgi:alpha-tubulin suppressor-like RCC1 family protein